MQQHIKNDPPITLQKIEIDMEGPLVWMICDSNDDFNCSNLPEAKNLMNPRISHETHETALSLRLNLHV